SGRIDEARRSKDGIPVVTAQFPLFERGVAEPRFGGGTGPAGVPVEIGIEDEVIVFPAIAEQAAGAEKNDVIGEKVGGMRLLLCAHQLGLPIESEDVVSNHVLPAEML